MVRLYIYRNQVGEITLKCNMCLYNIYRKCDKLSAREFDVLYLILKSKQQQTKTVSETQLAYLISIIYFFSTLKLLGVGCTCTLILMCEFRVHGGVKFEVYMVQGCTMYWYRWHRLRCIQVFFELFYTILVIQNFYRLYCIGDD